MITNIFLGLILGIVIISFIILNNKINIIQDYLGTIIRKLNSINSVINSIYDSNYSLLDRFNDFLLRYNERNGLLETKINHNIEYFDKTLTDISNKTNDVNEHFTTIKDLIDKNKIEIHNTQELLHNIPVRLETFITEENDSVRNDIKKLAKISSKKKQASKQSKSINKQ